jgi:uncharacterized protein (DUF983 family)
MPPRSITRALHCALKLGCPRCGERTVFSGLFTMNEECAVCHLLFEREPGYFVGAIYLNYAATAVVAIGGYLLLDAYAAPTVTEQIVLWGAFSVAFPLLFFRYSKSLWLAFDHFISPEAPDLRSVRGRHI